MALDDPASEEAMRDRHIPPIPPPPYPDMGGWPLTDDILEAIFVESPMLEPERPETAEDSFTPYDFENIAYRNLMVSFDSPRQYPIASSSEHWLPIDDQEPALAGRSRQDQECDDNFEILEPEDHKTYPLNSDIHLKTRPDDESVDVPDDESDDVPDDESVDESDDQDQYSSIYQLAQAPLTFDYVGHVLASHGYLGTSRLPNGDEDDFRTAKSVYSHGTFYTASVGGIDMQSTAGRLPESSEYARLLAKQKLWPVDPMIEQDWSGRGQHAEFQSNEQHLINNLLVVQENLGSTVTAIVQSVKCRRILLARKAITCGKQTMTKEQAVAEVAHMTRLSHAHILRVIGTYVKGRELSILLYPVAEYNLAAFLEDLSSTSVSVAQKENSYLSATHFFPCLSNGVRHIHSTLTKHMDIKPQNILVRLVDAEDKYRVYIADFGIAKSYSTPDAIETDGRTSFTRTYAAPEVVLQDKRGLPADIFSLGCVFLEIINALWPTSTEGFGTIIADSGPKSSYEANIDLIQSKYGRPTFIYNNGDEQLLVDLPLTMKMLNRDPKDRPTAEQLCKHFGTRPCCTEGPPVLEAMSSSSSNESLEENTSPVVENTTKDYLWKSHGHKGWIASCSVADAGDCERGCTCGHNPKDGDVRSAGMHPFGFPLNRLDPSSKSATTSSNHASIL